MKYSTKSDVWSYGMVMYEIWSLGHKPFEEAGSEEVRNEYYSVSDGILARKLVYTHAMLCQCRRHFYSQLMRKQIIPLY